jgi:iron complex outermembrane receptor protein
MKQLINIMLLLATTFIYSQNTFEGKIIDNTTKIEMPFVNVYIPNIEKGTVTNEDGLFKITDLPSGKFKIIFSMIGYETLSMEITFPNETFYNIEMTASAIEMEDVIISMPFHKLQSENVMKVERETIKNLKSNGAVTLSSGISDIAGVESITTGLGIGKPVIRGLSSNRVLVYTQGVRLENQQYGDEHGLGLNDAGIESVEVIKGPASLLYGSDALGGVLYLNPEKFADTNKSSGDFSGNYFSNTSGYNTNAGYKASGDNFKFLFRGSLAEHSDYNTDAYRVTNTRFREQDFKAGLGYQKSNFKTEFRYNINNSKIGVPEEIGEQSKNKAPLLPYQNITNHIFSSKSTLFFNDSKLDINLGYIYNDRKEFEDHHHHEGDEDHDEDHGGEHEDEHEEEYEILEPALHMKLKTLNYDIKYSLPDIGSFETIVGVQGMSQTNSNYGEEELIPNATTNDVGFLAVTHAHFNGLGIQIGARYDSRFVELESGFNRNFNSFNGSAGIKFNINQQITTRLNLATGFRAPNLSELFSDGTHEGTNRYEIGNSDLNNEQNFQTDLAVEFKNEHIEFFVNGFYNIINDYIFISPNGDVIDDDPVFVYLQNDARLYGGELGFHLHPHPLDWLHLESSFESVTGQLDDDSYLPLIPANNLTNTVRVEFEKPWINQGYAFIKLQSTFNQNNISAFETPTDSYNLLSAGIGGTLKLFNNDLLINISGTNLTNARFISHLSRLKPDGIFNMGRNFNLGFTYYL